MNCEEFQNVMLDLARDAEEAGRSDGLDPAIVKEALDHAETCAACDALLEEAEAITASLRDLAAQHASEAAPARVEKALLRSLEFRRSFAAHVALRRRLLIGCVAGIAAMSLVAISLLSNARTPLSRPALEQLFEKTWATLSQRGSQNPPASIGQAGHEPLATVTSSRDGGAAGAGWLSGLGDDDNISSEFVPLSQTFDPASADDDMIVRVVLSRAALNRFGVHLDSNAKNVAGNQVVADMIVTNDGTPQAIRVVAR